MIMVDISRKLEFVVDIRQFMELMGVTLCLFNIAMENDPFIDGLPIKKL